MVRKVDISSPAWMPGFDGRVVDGTGLVVDEEVELEVESVDVTGGAEQSDRSRSSSCSCLGGESSRARPASRDPLFSTTAGEDWVMADAVELSFCKQF